MVIDGEKLKFVVKDSPEMVFCDLSKVADFKLNITDAPLFLVYVEAFYFLIVVAVYI